VVIEGGRSCQGWCRGGSKTERCAKNDMGGVGEGEQWTAKGGKRRKDQFTKKNTKTECQSLHFGSTPAEEKHLGSVV